MPSLKALAGIPAAVDENQKEAADAGRSVGAKTRMINEYAASTKAQPVESVSTPDRPMRVNPKARYGDRPGEKRIDTKDMLKPLGSFKKGGKVKKTGVYKVHKNERVLNPTQTAKFEKKGGLSALSGTK